MDIVRVSQVFVPGKLPAYTYNPRPELSLEQQLNDYVEEAGSILTVAGPTKTGKSRVLQHMTKIAAKRATEPVPTEEELDGHNYEPDAVPDVQPVLEYLEDGPSSALHIADPFFAFYLKWGADQHLSRVG
jgi:hypothetical protein